HEGARRPRRPPPARRAARRALGLAPLPGAHRARRPARRSRRALRRAARARDRRPGALRARAPAALPPRAPRHPLRRLPGGRGGLPRSPLAAAPSLALRRGVRARGGDGARRGAPLPAMSVLSTMSRLRLFTVFHANLDFSALPDADVPLVLERCYWPLLRLVSEDGLRIGIEMPARTLERVAREDPDWTKALRGLVEQGRVEVVGSGLAQVAGPLLPAEVNRAGLALGR